MEDAAREAPNSCEVAGSNPAPPTFINTKFGKMSSIITEGSYQRSLWNEKNPPEWSKKDEPTLDDVYDEHNKVMIALQGDHDAEMERMRHLLANAYRDLNYSNQAKEVLKSKLQKLQK